MLLYWSAFQLALLCLNLWKVLDQASWILKIVRKYLAHFWRYGDSVYITPGYLAEDQKESATVQHNPPQPGLSWCRLIERCVDAQNEIADNYQTHISLSFWKGLVAVSEVSCGTVFLCTDHRAESPASNLPELPGFRFPEVWQIQDSESGGVMNHSAFLMSLPCVVLGSIF